jgi:hypothetical protein
MLLSYNNRPAIERARVRASSMAEAESQLNEYLCTSGKPFETNGNCKEQIPS